MKRLVSTLALILVTFISNAQSCPDENHPHVIDLGIGLKFSCCNLGASKPEDFGDYYAWGEIEEKAEYSFENYLYGSHDQSGSQTFTQIGDISATQYDAAYVKLGDSWRIPMEADVKMLYMECRFEDATYNDVSGIKFTGPNGNSIFLPFPGNKDSNTDNDYQGEKGEYWLSSQYGVKDANFLRVKTYRYIWVAYGDRYIGRSIRPVYIDRNGLHTCPDSNHPHAIDLGLPSGKKWACCNVGATDPIQYGEYFSWGETKQKDTYGYETYAYCHGKDGDYSATSWDFLGNDIGGTQYDAAYVNWGEGWRMPNHDDVKELINNCEYVPTDNNIKGLVFTGPNKQSIFLPSGYWAYLGKLADVTYNRQNYYSGYYWTSSQNMDYYYQLGFGYVGNVNLAFALEFNAVPYKYYVHEPIEYIDVCEYRNGGMNIRPIQNVTSSMEMAQDNATPASKGVFSIQGTKISDDTRCLPHLHPGIYIVNGKKYVIK